ncbi:MAG: hypoxanthine phosphoribosyltransferase [Planctomycetota bacterium]|jgi:hypoxanthine phosphoribosyltransferase
MGRELEVLLSAEKIAGRVDELAAAVAADFEGKNVLVVGVLKGAWVFLADLVRRIPFPVEVDFLKVSSYGRSTVSAGELRFELDLERSLEGREILLVEDIVDTGVTLETLKANLLSRKPAAVKLCSLLDKPSRRVAPVTLDYLGFEIPDKFVVGYGLDCAEAYRNLPYVAALTAEQAQELTGGDP